MNVGNRGRFRLSASVLQNFTHVNIFDRMAILDVKGYTDPMTYEYAALHPSFRTISLMHEPLPKYDCLYHHETDSVTWRPRSEEFDYNERGALIVFNQTGTRLCRLSSCKSQCHESELSQAYNVMTHSWLPIKSYDVPDSVDFKQWCKREVFK